MNRLFIIIYILLITFKLSYALDAPINLQIEGKNAADKPGIDNIAGIDTPTPQFEWTADVSTTQASFQLILADNSTDIGNDTGNIWDSGNVSSTTENCYYYGSTTLLSNNTYYWKVRTWDLSESSSSYSSSYQFRMNHFILQQNFSMGFSKKKIGYSIGDLNSDGLNDFVQSNFDGNQVAAFINTGTGTFSQSWQNSTSTHKTYSKSLVLADIDSDSDLDLIILNELSTNEDDTLIYKNDGSGNFSFFYELDSPIGNGSYAIALGDIDRDGDLDFIEANYGGQNDYFTNDGSGNFLNQNVNFPTDTSSDIILADLNGDCYLDLIVGNEGEENYVYLNTGISTSPWNTTPDWSSAEPHDDTVTIALIDLEGDGDWDFIAGNDNDPDRYYVNDGNGGISLGGSTASDRTYSLSTGDIDNDGDMDYIASDNSSFFNDKIYINNGSGSFSNSCNAFNSNQKETLRLSLHDLNGDGSMDVLKGLRENLYDSYFINHPEITNNGPSAPSSGFAANHSTTTFLLKLEWAQQNLDDWTDPEELSYNIRFGTAPGCYNIISGAIGSTDNSGSSWGNIGRSTYVYLNIQPSVFFWQVQAIDTSKSTGAWSAEQKINNEPFGGWNSDDIILSTCASQWTIDMAVNPPGSPNIEESRRGLVDIYFKAKDMEINPALLTSFEYSTSTTGDWTSLSDTSTYLTQDSASYAISQKNLWPDNDGNYFTTVSATTSYSAATAHHFTWDSNNMPELQNIQCNQTRIRFKAADIYNSTSNFITSETFSIDNIPPSQPGGFSSSGVYGSDYYVINLDTDNFSIDVNFLEYKIFIATNNSNVGLMNKDSIWDKYNDINLSSATFNGASSSTITGLASDTTYYIKMYAYDGYANYSSTSSFMIKTNDKPALTVAEGITRVTAQQRSDASELVDITFYGIDNDVESSNYISIECIYSIGGSTYVMTSSSTDSNHNPDPLSFSTSLSTYVFVWNAGVDVPNISSSTFQARIALTDGKATGYTDYTLNFIVDTIVPDCNNLWNTGATSNSLLWQWDQTTDPNFNRYELWYSSTGYQYTISKDTGNADYSSMYTNIDSTATTGLQITTTYWACLWIYDDYGHTVRTDTTTYLTGTPPVAYITQQPVQLTDGSGRFQFKVNIYDNDGSNCALKVEYSTKTPFEWNPAKLELSDTLYGTAAEVNADSSDYRIQNIQTQYAAQIVTNTVTVNWLSKEAMPGDNDVDNIYDTQVYLHITVKDEIVTGSTMTTTLFPLDNSQPEFYDSDLSLSRYEHYTSSGYLSIRFTGEHPLNPNETMNSTNTDTSKFIVSVSSSDYISLAGSTVTSAVNRVFLDIPYSQNNQISRWDGEGQSIYLTLLSSATTDIYGNCSLEYQDIPFSTMTWYNDTTSPQITSAVYEISEEGNINVELFFDEYVDILSTDLDLFKIQDATTAATNFETLGSSCTITNTSNDATSLKVDLYFTKHDIIWNWSTSVLYIAVSSNAISDLSGNAVIAIPDTSAMALYTSISSGTPNIVSFTPFSDSYNISVDTTIFVSFNTFLKPIVDNCISLTQIKDSQNQDVQNIISGNIVFNKMDKYITFTPDTSLPGNSIIKVTIDNYFVRNFADIKMSDKFSWHFKTTLKSSDDNVIISPSGRIIVNISKNQLPTNGMVDFTENIPPHQPKKTQISSISEASTAESTWNNSYHYPFDEITSEIIFISDTGDHLTPVFEQSGELIIDYSDCLINNESEYLNGNNKAPVKENTLKIYYLNEVTNNWMPINSHLDTELNNISAYIEHFSVYTIMGDENYDIENAHPYPVPYKPNDPEDGIPEAFIGTLRSGITFTKLPSECEIEIFTITGRLVNSMHHSDSSLQINGQVGNYYWYPVENSYNSPVASGVYIYYLTGGNKHKSGKLMIIK